MKKTLGEPSKIGKKRNVVYTIDKKVGAKIDMLVAKLANIVYQKPQLLSEITEKQFYSKGLKSVYDDEKANVVCVKPNSQIQGNFEYYNYIEQMIIY